MDDETRKVVRRAISGQDKEPVQLETSDIVEGPQMNNHYGDVEVTIESVLELMKQLYPDQFARCVAEAKANKLAEIIQELQADKHKVQQDKHKIQEHQE